MSGPDTREECTQCGQLAYLNSGFCSVCEFTDSIFDHPATISAGGSLNDNCMSCGAMHGRRGELCAACETDVLEQYERTFHR